MHRYHVTSEADVTYKADGIGKSLERQFKDKPERLVHYKIRNAHVTIRPALFVKVLKQALQRLHADSTALQLAR